MTQEQENTILAQIVQGRKDEFLRTHYPNPPEFMYLAENEVHKFKIHKIIVYIDPDMTVEENNLIYSNSNKYICVSSLKEMLGWLTSKAPKYKLLYSGSYDSRQGSKVVSGYFLHKTRFKALMHCPTFMRKISNFMLVFSMTMWSLDLMAGGYKHWSTIILASIFLPLTVIMLLVGNRKK